LNNLKELFLKLVSIDSPAGFEDPMMKVLKQELEPYVDNISISTRGNVVGKKVGTTGRLKKNKNPTPSLALIAHIDSIGFLVSFIEERGFIRFRKLGGPVDRAIQGQQVRLMGKKGPILGVVGMKPGHITTPEESRRIPSIEEMYIDIGVESAKEAAEIGVQLGTPIVYNMPPITLAKKNMIASPYVDNRGGCAALIQVAEQLKDYPHEYTIYYVGTVEEEIGWRGAQCALYNNQPDMAVVIDTAPAGWQPDVIMRDLVYEIGKGPIIKVSEMSNSQIIGHPKVREWLIETAEKEKIPYQIGAGISGTSDIATTQQSGSGIPTVSLCLPRRYSHSPIEVFDLMDLQNLVKLLVSALKSVKTGFNLERG
jgi:endoglucanase